MSEKIVQFSEEISKGQLKELVRGSVEETLNGLLEQEAKKLTQAARYERNEARQGHRNGHYDIATHRYRRQRYATYAASAKMRFGRRKTPRWKQKLRDAGGCGRSVSGG